MPNSELRSTSRFRIVVKNNRPQKIVVEKKYENEEAHDNRGVSRS